MSSPGASSLARPIQWLVYSIIMNGDLQQCLSLLPSLLSRLESSQHTDDVNLSEFLVFQCEDVLELLHVLNCECNILAVYEM